ncbi:MAG TPA: DUF2619 domain-containing protein [Firmicutes bacterium]|jgi:hypothetical protein|nr:DUF2619 domain-containing protein [Bacillota bacterium]
MDQLTLNSMAIIRVISGLLEIAVAIIFLKGGRVENALRMNAFLGLIGPLVFLLVSALGVVAIAVKISWPKMLMICSGIILVMIGTKN